MEETVKRRYTKKDKRWCFWIIFKNNRPIGLASGVNANQAIMNYLVHQHPETDNKEVAARLNEYLEEFSAELANKNQSRAIEKFFDCLAPRKPKTKKTYKIVIEPDKSWQLKIFGLPPIDTTLDALD